MGSVVQRNHSESVRFLALNQEGIGILHKLQRAGHVHRERDAVQTTDRIVMDVCRPVVTPLGFGPWLYRHDTISRIDDDAGRAEVIERPRVFFQALVCCCSAAPDSVHVGTTVCRPRRIKILDRFKCASVKRCMGVFGTDGVGYPGLASCRAWSDKRSNGGGNQNGSDEGSAGYRNAPET